MEYGVEIWGWKDVEELEKVMLDYMRWLFDLDFYISRYLITKELRMDKLRIGWCIRRCEEKLEMSVTGKIAKECWQKKNSMVGGIDIGRRV